LPFSSRLLSLDRDPQAVHGIAGGPLARGMLSAMASPGRAQPAPRALQPVARLVVYSASCEGHGNDVAPRMVDVRLTDSTCPALPPNDDALGGCCHKSVAAGCGQFGGARGGEICNLLPWMLPRRPCTASFCPKANRAFVPNI
jgi:hypothetical protein